jgi:hypothetical protein
MNQAVRYDTPHTPDLSDGSGRAGIHRIVFLSRRIRDIAWRGLEPCDLCPSGAGWRCPYKRPGFLANATAVTALILSPIVYVGGLVSWLLEMAGGVSPGAAGSVHGAHYVSLALNMLSVIPLALAIVAAIPFDRLEQRLLRKAGGISTGEKYLLMFIRVFNHIVYFVIPNILEVMREEALLRTVSENASLPAGPRRLRLLGRRLTAGMVQVGVSGICASVRFIPLWAREIDDLPRRKPKKFRSRT